MLLPLCFFLPSLERGRERGEERRRGERRRKERGKEEKGGGREHHHRYFLCFLFGDEKKQAVRG
jgi:hypothetical protein